MPDTWPESKQVLASFFTALTHWSHDRADDDETELLYEFLTSIFSEPDPSAAHQEYVDDFVKQPGGSLRAFQMTDATFMESAASLIARLQDPQLDDETFAAVRADLWRIWCRWMRPWQNTSAPAMPD